MDERRKLPRKYLIIYSRIFDRESGKLLGYLGDLSLKGAMVISENQLSDDQSLSLRFDLPDVNTFGSDHLDIRARVVHCQPDVSPTFFNIGFEFIGATPEQIKVIEKMMIAYEFRREAPNYPIPPSLLE